MVLGNTGYMLWSTWFPVFAGLFSETICSCAGRFLVPFFTQFAETPNHLRIYIFMERRQNIIYLLKLLDSVHENMDINGNSAADGLMIYKGEKGDGTLSFPTD